MTSTILSLTIREKKKENHNVGTSPHLLTLFASILPSYASQEKCNKSSMPSFIFFLDFLKKKEKTPTSSIVSGFPVVSVSVSHRQTPTSFTRQILVHVGGTRILDSAVLHAYLRGW